MDPILVNQKSLGIPSYGGFSPQIITPNSIAQFGRGDFSSLNSNNPVNSGVRTDFGSLDFTDKAGLALQGLSTIGGLYAAFQQLGLAKKQFNFQKQAWDTNLGNQIKSYNTALEDRARARAAMEGQSQEQANTYIEQNRMTR